jgi:hypothetical protein
MKIALIIFIIVGFYIQGFPQTSYILEDRVIVNTNCTGSDFSPVIQIPRNAKTSATFRNNSITYCPPAVYLVMLGDDGPGPNDNHLDGAIVTGNKLTHTGYELFPGGVMHGLMAGYQINQVYKWNYFDDVCYPVVYKSGGGSDHVGMINTAGGFSYNIVINGKRLGIKGTSGVRVYNNTFYCDRSTLNDYPFIKITSNNDDPLNTPLPVSHGTKIKNNIFYSTVPKKFFEIEFSSESFIDFECDYNLYFVTGGNTNDIKFQIDGGIWINWTQWRAMGYDAHSIVLDPNFIDRLNFVPSSRLSNGVNLGPSYNVGLAVDAVWGSGNPATATQNGVWQVGAYVYTSTSIEDIKSEAPIFRTIVNENSLDVMFDSDHTGYQLSLFTLIGQIVKNKPIDGNVCQFSIASLPEGMYILAVSKQGLFKVRKVFLPR